MAVKLSKITEAKGCKTIELEYGGETLTVKYNKNKYTPAFESEIRDLIDKDLPGNMLAKMAYGLVVDWDLVFDIQTEENLSKPEGQRETTKVPITWETFQVLPMEFLDALFQKISEDNRPDPKASSFTSNT